MLKQSIRYLFVFILFLTSCAPLPYVFKARTYVPGQNKGLLVCSVKTDKSTLGSINPSYYIRKKGTDERLRIHLDGLSVPKEEVENGKYCNIVIFELPAGNYELFHWNLFYNYGLIQYERQPKEEFSIAFSVKPDSINYIGELTIDHYVMRIANRKDRDIKIAIEEEPSISSLPVVKYDMPCEAGCSRKIETTNEFFYLPIVH